MGGQMAEDKKVTESEKSPEEEKGQVAEETPTEEGAVEETPEKKEEPTAEEGTKPEEESKAEGESKAEAQPESEPEPQPEPTEQEPAEAAETAEPPAAIKPEDLKKPLDKMTAKELREVALGIPGITGVHAMKKEDLLAAITEAWGIKEEKAPPKKVEKAKPGAGVAELKARIREIKVKRAEAIKSKDKRMAKIYRRQISRLKKRTRRIA